MWASSPLLLTRSQSDSPLSFSLAVKPYLRRSLSFLPKLYTTSEEEGRAKPSPRSHYRENHTISLPLSGYGPPSTVLLVDGVCLCHRSTQAFILNESKDRGRLRVRGGECKAWTCLGNTTETPSWVLAAAPGPLTELTDTGKVSIFSFLWSGYVWNVFYALEKYSNCWKFRFSQSSIWIKNLIYW